MSKKQFFKSPFVIAAFCCFTIAGATLVIFPQTQTSVKGITQKIVPTITSKPTQSPTPTTIIQKQTQKVAPAQNNATQISPTVTAADHASQTISSTPVKSQSTEQKTTIQQTLRVKLSINGSSVGTVEVPEGANQCDVLTRAKDQGKIASLLMKFDTSLGTNGVYQINGVGKENTVWWVYKVNGKSPAQGCSYIKANNDDEVVWEYKG